MMIVTRGANAAPKHICSSMFPRSVTGLSPLSRYNSSMRCDLHVHTIHSGMCTVPGLRRICRESYNDPLAVYEKLKRLGMDLVTIADHDSIDAVEALRSR